MKFSVSLITTGLFVTAVCTAQISDKLYCNGQPFLNAGDQLYANGQRQRVGNDLVYPNGVRVNQAGDIVYPNGQRLMIAGDEYHMSGQRVQIAGDLYYPNRQRVQIGSDCFFQTGVKMNQCPTQAHFEDFSENILSSGSIDLKSGKILDQKFSLTEPTVTTSWKMDRTGNISDIETHCDESLF